MNGKSGAKIYDDRDFNVDKIKLIKKKDFFNSELAKYPNDPFGYIGYLKKLCDSNGDGTFGGIALSEDATKGHDIKVSGGNFGSSVAEYLTEGLNFRRAFREAGFHISGVCVWVKNSLVLGRSPYQWQHEPVLYGWLPNGKHKWFADRKQSTIWNFDKPKKSEQHPTMKPITLCAKLIYNSSHEDDTVYENVKIPLLYGEVKKSEYRTRVKEILEKVEMGKYIDKKVSELSGGQRQRVAIARALVNQPFVILADEPTGALDGETAEQVMDILYEYADEKRILIVVTHDLQRVKREGVRVIKMEHGKIWE